MRSPSSRPGAAAWVFGSARLKEELVIKERVKTPPEDHWRVSFLVSLLDQRQRLHFVGLKEEEKVISGLIDSLCIN